MRVIWVSPSEAWGAEHPQFLGVLHREAQKVKANLRHVRIWRPACTIGDSVSKKGICVLRFGSDLRVELAKGFIE